MYQIFELVEIEKYIKELQFFILNDDVERLILMFVSNELIVEFAITRIIPFMKS